MEAGDRRHCMFCFSPIWDDALSWPAPDGTRHSSFRTCAWCESGAQPSDTFRFYGSTAHLSRACGRGCLSCQRACGAGAELPLNERLSDTNTRGVAMTMLA
jgi:hypothetical protein